MYNTVLYYILYNTELYYRVCVGGGGGGVPGERRTRRGWDVGCNGCVIVCDMVCQCRPLGGNVPRLGSAAGQMVDQAATRAVAQAASP